MMHAIADRTESKLKHARTTRWFMFGLMSLALTGACAAPDGGAGVAGRSGLGRARAGAKGLPWTILCLELQGEHRDRVIDDVAAVLRDTPGIRADAVLVRHDSDGYTRLYYGTYRRRIDRETGKPSLPPRVRADLASIRSLGTPMAGGTTGQYFFRRAYATPLPPPDVGNPDWALIRADGVYTLQIAAFVSTDDFTEFKRAAAEYCTRLRDLGHEAYYHHSQSVSIVTVGAFGADAIYNTEVLSADRRAKIEVAHYSANVLALQKNELFKYNTVNGRYLRERRNGRLGDPPSSQLVLIPKLGRAPQ